MKIILFLFVFSSFLFSQSYNSKDKLVTKAGSIQECIVKEINSNYLVTISEKAEETKFVMNNISLIKIDGLGDVYSSKTGFTTSIDYLNDYLLKRNSKLVFMAIKEQTEIKEPNEYFNTKKRFFFSIYYFPITEKQNVVNYYPTRYYLSSDMIYPSYYYQIVQNAFTMESQFGFNLDENYFMTLSLGYSGDLYSRKSKTTEINSYDGTTLTRISEDNSSMDKILIELGLKYYFGSPNVSEVNPFVILSVGKQFAFADNFSSSYYSGQINNYSNVNNENEFLEGLNSPIFVSAGFGTEYFFTESLSLSGFVKVKYSYASSNYEWQELQLGVETNKGNEDVTNSSVNYKSGLGLTFFF